MVVHCLEYVTQKWHDAQDDSWQLQDQKKKVNGSKILEEKFTVTSEVELGQEHKIVAKPLPVINDYRYGASQYNFTINKQSTGYGIISVIATYPIPSEWLSFLPTGSKTDWGLRLWLGCDLKWNSATGPGEYIPGENLQVDWFGFDSPGFYKISTPRKLNGLMQWILELSGVISPSEIYPLPHVTIGFKTEIVGQPGGMWSVDYDISTSVDMWIAQRSFKLSAPGMDQP